MLALAKPVAEKQQADALADDLDGDEELDQVLMVKEAVKADADEGGRENDIQYQVLVMFVPSFGTGPGRRRRRPG